MFQRGVPYLLSDACLPWVIPTRICKWFLLCNTCLFSIYHYERYHIGHSLPHRSGPILLRFSDKITNCFVHLKIWSHLSPSISSTNLTIESSKSQLCRSQGPRVLMSISVSRDNWKCTDSSRKLTNVGPPMLAACWTLYGIAGVVVLMRVYTQLKITRQFGIGDSVMILSLVSCQLPSRRMN